MKYYNLVLASQSPRRKELIGRIKCVRHVEIVPADVDEDYGELCCVSEIVTSLAERKARYVHAKTGGLVLGADTLVSLDGSILGKPSTRREAVEMLRLLCGKTHLVTTGICLIGSGRVKNAFESTLVTFDAFDEGIVQGYIETGKPFDKAGGYGIQDAELLPLIKRVDGDISNVIGLPLALTEKLLKENF